MEAYGVTIVLVEANPEEVDFPTTLYMMCENGRVTWRGIIVPPLLYPDGHWYVKGAGGGEHLKPLEELREFKAWVRTGGSREAAESFRAVLSELMPDWRFGSTETKPCMSSHNVVDAPYIDFVTERLAVATACDHGVAGAVEIGRLAARMLIDTRWRLSPSGGVSCAVPELVPIDVGAPISVRGMGVDNKPGEFDRIPSTRTIGQRHRR